MSSHVTQPPGTTRCELDTHADTCAFGRNSYIVSKSSQKVSVAGFHPDMKEVTNVEIVTAAVAYDCPDTFVTHILIFPQSLYFPQMDHNLLCPDQMREAGIIVNDIPLLRIEPKHRTTEHHSIIDHSYNLHIPLKYDKPISYFICRKPSIDEIHDTLNNIHVQMTSDAEWSPYDEQAQLDEELLRESINHRRTNTPSLELYAIERHGITSSTNGLGDRYSIFGLKVTHRKGTVTADELSRRWRCGLETARKTLNKTTQRAVRDFTDSRGMRRLKPTAYQLKYPRIRTELYTDTYYGPCVSLEGNKFCQIYASKYQWCRAFPMRDKKDAHLTQDKLFRTVGLPTAIIPDYALELTKGKFLKNAQRAQVHILPVEPYMHNLNFAETCIREVLRLYHRFMIARAIPKVLWDRCFVYCCEIRSHMALGHYDQEGECGATIIHGETADISHLVEFSFYDWIWFISPKEAKYDRMMLGRWLGPSFDVGEALTFAVLTSSAEVVHRSSVLPLSVEERNSDETKILKVKFTEAIERKLGERAEGIVSTGNEDVFEKKMDEERTPYFVPYEDDEMDSNLEEDKLQESEEENPVGHDKYISAKVQLQRGDTVHRGTVRRRKRDNEGKLIGFSHENPILDTALYEVEFEDGHVEAYYANQIAEAIYATVDTEGYEYSEVKEIVDHSKDGTAIRPDDGFVMLRGKRIPKRTTKGWHICVEWKDGTTSWLSMKDVKESNPVLLAEYAIANKLVSEPAFQWWVPYTIKKRDRIIKAVKKRYFRKLEKFGLELPKSVKRALEIDQETGTKYWQEAIRKEIGTVLPALEVLEKGDSPPVGSTLIDFTIVFDVKMDFTRKARICARGDQTDPPSSITYASVVTRESVRLGFLLAALNNLQVLSADVAGAYLNAPCAERVHTILGPEFGDNEGKVAVIRKALYGLRSAGFAWRSHCAEIMRTSLEFQQCRADQDVWMRKSVKSTGEKYWEYVFIYTDDVIVISENPNHILSEMNKHFLLKADSIGPPTRYLGANISEFFITGDERAKWAIGSQDYVREAVRVVKAWLEQRGMQLKTKTSGVLPNGYRPELESSEILGQDEAHFYMQAIGILRWIVELGRVDICGEVSMMSSYSMSPREGHLEAVLHIFSYLAAHDRSRIVMDDSYFPHAELDRPDWGQFYPDAKEDLPPDMPEPRGKEVQITMFVDASHAANVITRQSRTGVLIFVNRAPILWFSKKQSTIETSSFGSEFQALKVGMELLIGLRYKIRMMGVPLEGYAHVKVDNMSVVKNTSVPESQLKKKSNSIAYHFVRQQVAADIARISYEPTNTNLADMLTKVQPGTTRQRLARMVMF
jgi:Fe-S-cluster containining protein